MKAPPPSRTAATRRCACTLIECRLGTRRVTSLCSSLRGSFFDDSLGTSLITSLSFFVGASLDAWATQRTVLGTSYFPRGNAGPDNLPMQSAADRSRGVVTVTAASCAVLQVPPAGPLRARLERLERSFFWWCAN